MPIRWLFSDFDVPQRADAWDVEEEIVAFLRTYNGIRLPKSFKEHLKKKYRLNDDDVGRASKLARYRFRKISKN